MRPGREASWLAGQHRWLASLAGQTHVPAVAVGDLVKRDVVVEVVQDHHRRVLRPPQRAELPVLLLRAAEERGTAVEQVVGQLALGRRAHAPLIDWPPLEGERLLRLGSLGSGGRLEGGDEEEYVLLLPLVDLLADLCVSKH